MLFERQLRVLENNTCESAGPGEGRAGHRSSLLRTFPPALLRKSEKSPVDLPCWPHFCSLQTPQSTSPGNQAPFLCTLMESLWPRSPKIPHNATKSPSPHTILGWVMHCWPPPDLRQPPLPQLFLSRFCLSISDWSHSGVSSSSLFPTCPLNVVGPRVP